MTTSRCILDVPVLLYIETALVKGAHWSRVPGHPATKVAPCVGGFTHFPSYLTHSLPPSPSVTGPFPNFPFLLPYSLSSLTLLSLPPQCCQTNCSLHLPRILFILFSPPPQLPSTRSGTRPLAHSLLSYSFSPHFTPPQCYQAPYELPFLLPYSFPSPPSSVT